MKNELSNSINDIVISNEKKSAIIFFKNKKFSIKGLEHMNKKSYNIKFCKKNDQFIKRLEKEKVNENVKLSTRNRNRYMSLSLTHGESRNQVPFMTML
mgnify:FL=1